MSGIRNAWISVSLALVVAVPVTAAPVKPRARDLGVPFSGTPGPDNAITDVAGVEVGMTTLIEGDGKLVRGKGPVRTGVTVILPRGKTNNTPVLAGAFSLNGNGEMTGLHLVEEFGMFNGPIALTNTLAVGTVHTALVKWQVARKLEPINHLPIVAETWDEPLNDIYGFHVTEQHVFAALDAAKPGPVPEGNVGGGTGMRCHGYKCGTGSASRKLKDGHVLGVLVQANHGSPWRLSIAGVPMAELRPAPPVQVPPPAVARQRDSSIVIVIATDAPLLSTQLKAIAKRAALGVGRVGGLGETMSGDLFLAFSTGNAQLQQGAKLQQLSFVDGMDVNALYGAAVDATEEAIVNALFAAETMRGADGYEEKAIPQLKVIDVLRAHGRLR